MVLPQISAGKSFHAILAIGVLAGTINPAATCLANCVARLSVHSGRKRSPVEPHAFAGEILRLHSRALHFAGSVSRWLASLCRDAFGKLLALSSSADKPEKHIAARHRRLFRPFFQRIKRNANSMADISGA